LQDIRLLKESDLAEWVRGQSLPSFRTRQIRKWLWQKHVNDFDQMTDLPAELREKLKDDFIIPFLKPELMQQSADGTVKTRFILADGNKIEAVLIPVTQDNRYTVCVSSQVGCSLSCSFCATGRMGRVRNLSYTEIVDQVVAVNAQCEEIYNHPLTNIVYMGMGEPLLNYSNTLESIRLITSPEGLGMSPSRITVSTAGIAKMIRKLADDGAKVKLALSLHAANDTKRDQIMPINDQNNIETLMEALDYFYTKTKNRITYEYLALRDFNDQPEDARQLALLTKRFPVRINVIEYNVVEGIPFQRSDNQKVHAFLKILVAAGANVTLRKSRGQDIDAACGQLANKE